MGALADAFREAAQSRKDAEWVQSVCEVARKGMWPFDPKSVSVSLYEAGFDRYGERTFRVDVGADPERPFLYKLDERQILQAYFPEDFVYQSIKDPLLKHYRYRPSLPVDDHIVLGEE